jgi:hypothetical protein
MLCEHLQPLEAELKAIGVKETFRGQPWSSNCREWVFFDCYLDQAALRQRMKLAEVIEDHSISERFQGEERGFVRREHHDGIMGLYEPKSDRPTIK